MNVAEAQRLCLLWNVPFYSYRLPGEKDFFWGAQLGGEVLPFRGMSDVQGEEGFVAVPFRETENSPALFIRKDVSFVNETENSGIEDGLRNYRRGIDKMRMPLPGVSKEEYDKQIIAVIAALKRRTVSKVVLSRSLVVECDALERAPEWFVKLADSYPEAFVFLISVPGVMTWMGATPEIFLRQAGGLAETMALAGTRYAGEKEVWGDKEIEEQQIVSRYVEDLLNGSGEWKKKGPFSKQAGKVEHLCTSFLHSGYLSCARVDELRRKLHPTPAVGGFPTRKAMALLEQTERYERRYYAGYLGPIGPDSVFQWFVNLRCMELFPRAACLYAGGGITALSDPEKEWEETEMKSRTLLDIMA